MIIERIMQVVDEIQLRMKKDKKRLDAIQSIRELLTEIDFTAEVVPVEDEDRLNQLLVSLKGGLLDPNEIEVIKEIVNN